MQRRGFTLLELMIAGVMAAIVLGGITVSLSQLGLSKAISRQRLDAFSRCDTALRTIRRDIISVLRRDDLFDTRLKIIHNTSRFNGREVDRDELLVFNSSLRANKEIDFNGEGVEYETQYRIDDDEFGVVLWKRRDPILDDNPLGGGIATPLGEGVVSLQLEAYDGDNWVPQWDSDEFGIPHAIRITIVATGMVDGDDFYIDLLFYHRQLKRLVAIELKIDKFKAKYKGQMELYLKWLVKHEKQDGENAPIGLILCTEASKEQIELLEMHKDGIMVAEYLTQLPPKKQLEEKIRQSLHEAKERIAKQKLLS